MSKNNSSKTLKEIAESAGVSVSMVSLILNGKGRASEKVRSKILKLLEDAGYKPKYARTPFYYILDLPSIEAAGKTENTMEQLSGMQSVFTDADLVLHVEFLPPGDAAAHRLHLEAIAGRKPSGVLVNTDAAFLKDACTIFSNQKIPVVQIGYDTEEPDYSAVVADSFTGAHMATRHLIKKGHTKLAILRWQGGLSKINSDKKFAGYHAALSEAGLEINQDYILTLTATEDESDWQPSLNLVGKLLELPDPPTALFVDNSFISLPLLYCLQEDQKQLHASLKKLEILHFEDWNLRQAHDILTTKLFYPEFKTKLVSINWKIIGRTGAKLLIDLAGQNSIVPQIYRISPTLQQVSGKKREPVSIE